MTSLSQGPIATALDDRLRNVRNAYRTDTSPEGQTIRYLVDNLLHARTYLRSISEAKHSLTVKAMATQGLTEVPDAE